MVPDSSIGKSSCLEESSCVTSSGTIGDGSCTKGGDGANDPSCPENSGTIGDGSCTGLGSCQGNSGTIGDGSWYVCFILYLMNNPVSTSTLILSLPFNTFLIHSGGELACAYNIGTIGDDSW